MKRLALAAGAAFALAGTLATPSTPSARPFTVEATLHTVPVHHRQYTAAYNAAVDAIGQAAVGRNIVTDGWRNERTGRVRLASRDEVIAATRRLVAAAAPQPVAAVGTRYTTGVSQSTLDAIAACESGGDPGAVSPGGTYRGKYQFDYRTWASVGGSGDPAAASEAEQDMRAAMLYAQSGPTPWPVCGA